jgi:hypothetical protein
MCINIRPTGCPHLRGGHYSSLSHAPRAYAVSCMLIAPSEPKLTSKGSAVVIIGLGRGERVASNLGLRLSRTGEKYPRTSLEGF